MECTRCHGTGQEPESPPVVVRIERVRRLPTSEEIAEVFRKVRYR